MRINTDGRFSFRTDLYDDAAEALGESTRSAGLDAASELVLELLGKPSSPSAGALDRVATALEDDRVPDEVAHEVAEALSVGPVDVQVATRTASVDVGDGE